VSKGYDQGVLASSRLSADCSERLDYLFRTYNRRVLGLARQHAAVRADADDIAGRVWVAVTSFFARGGQLLAPERAWPWLATVARREAGHFYRPCRASEQVRDWTDAMASSPLPAAPAADTAGDVLALADLTAPEARVMALAAQGLSQSAIAARLGLHKGTVSRQLYSGARRLRASVALAR
jgi:RNA polymerase sigma factor (sigma-70 family)